MIEVNGLNFSYGRTQILRDVHFRAERGTILSLIGPNGSGKSTLLRCLSGLLKTEGQNVKIDGKALSERKPQEIAQLVSFLPQVHEKVPSLRVDELVAMGRAPYHATGWGLNGEDRKKVAWAIEYMQIGHLKTRIVERLSGGEKQRVWIAMVLAQDTPFILLDEPVTYMDLKYQWDLLITLKNLKDDFGKTVIAVFHDINHALDISDCVYLLKDGSIYDSGDSEEVISEQSIHEVYGVCAHVCKFKKCRRSVVIPLGIRGKTDEKPVSEEKRRDARTYTHVHQCPGFSHRSPEESACRS